MNVTNLINLENVSLTYGKGMILDGVSLGISHNSRIGIVGRNGSGKSSLIRILASQEPPQSGRVSLSNDALVGTQESHQWAGSATIRDIMTGLFGGFDDTILNRQVDNLSGGERRRVALAQLLISDVNVMLLDEPTNHLDVEVVAWLANHLKNRQNLALAIVTHDRWFLDEVSDRTWEVVQGHIDEYDGGYSAYVLAKAERDRQQSVESHKRNLLIRKELAWLRRGAPARTAKPKFRIDAANALIENEPQARDGVELLAFANARLGKSVYEIRDVDITVGNKTLFTSVTWNIGPGDRIGIAGVNGAGKTTLLRLLSGSINPSAGKLVTGSTVTCAFLSQHLEELNPQWRVLEAVEHVARHIDLGKGKSLSASQLCERLGFSSDAQWTPVRDLSGGERRRLQLTRLLMSEPNVLLLDEPTNDFDMETLVALEDLLDSFAGTLIVVSHDRYFLERTCDSFVGILGDGKVRDLPRGIEEYLELVTHKSSSASPFSGQSPVATESAPAAPVLSAGQRRDLSKSIGKIERAMEKIDAQIAAILADMATCATNYQRIGELNAEHHNAQQKKDALEMEWLSLSERLES